VEGNKLGSGVKEARWRGRCCMESSVPGGVHIPSPFTLAMVILSFLSAKESASSSQVGASFLQSATSNQSLNHDIVIVERRTHVHTMATAIVSL
jgi:hypothetical protein